MSARAPRLRRQLIAPDQRAWLPDSTDALADDDVCVWLAETAAWNAPEDRQRLMRLISEDERARFQRFHFDQDRLAFLVAHGLVRMALSRSAPVAPVEWTFSADSYGKPSIAAPASTLSFSLSHTRGLVACAITRNRPLGVDVEDASRPAPLEIAERYFGPGERRDIFATDPDQRTRRFFEYWTLKEAYVKACGLGLSLPLDRFEFRRDAAGSWRIAFAPPPLDDPAAWWFHAWPTPTHQAAVALRTG
jgi:4'-phosphopantetheinyl transferase